MKKCIIAVLAVAAFAACGGGDGGGGGTTTALAGKATCTPTTGSGVVCGRVLAADGATPLASAEIQINSAAADVSASLMSKTTKGVEDATKCVTDTSGNFACIVPNTALGEQTFTIIFTGFTKTFTAAMTLDATTDAGNQTMTATSAEKWVVVPGAYDGVQVLLAQLKGCILNDMSGAPFDATTMTASLARASDDCTAKGLLVLSDNPTDPTYTPTFLISSSLADYNALFINCAADFSSETGVNAAIQSFNTGGKHLYFSDLADSWLTSAFPGHINFAGGSTSTGTVSGTVLNAGLAGVVGSPINIIFDLSSWADINTVEAGVNTFIEGDITSVSSTAGVHPITAGFRDAAGAGCIFYTSYHIEGASTGAPQELAIKYLVQNVPTVCPAL